MISNGMIAFLAEGIADHFSLDEINLLFQRAGFLGNEKRHWTRLGRAQAWLVELRKGFGSGEKLSALYSELIVRANDQNPSYLEFLHQLTEEIEEEFANSKSLKVEFQNNPAKRRLERAKGRLQKDIGSQTRKIAKRRPASGKAIALSIQSLEAVKDILQQSTYAESGLHRGNSIVLPIDKVSYEQLTWEVDASIAMLKAPAKPKRVIDYLKEFRSLLAEIKKVIASSTSVAAAIVVLIAALEKCIEALSLVIAAFH